MTLEYYFRSGLEGKLHVVYSHTSNSRNEVDPIADAADYRIALTKAKSIYGTLAVSPS